MAKNDLEAIADRISSVEERQDIHDNDIAALKTALRTASTLAARINQTQTDLTEINYDLNNKIASIRGMMAAQARDRPRSSMSSPAALPSHALVDLDPKVEQLVQAGQLSRKQADQLYQSKALMDVIGNLGEQGPRQEKELESRRNDTANTPAPRIPKNK